MNSYDGREDIWAPNNYMSPPDMADIFIIEYYSFVINIDYLIIYARHMYPTSKTFPCTQIQIRHFW